MSYKQSKNKEAHKHDKHKHKHHWKKYKKVKKYKNYNNASERYLDRYTHRMEFVRTITAVTILVLQLIILSYLSQ